MTRVDTFRFVMSHKGDTVAYSGSPPGRYPQSNVFDFVFGSPFKAVSDHVPPSQKLPPIEESRSIFVDNKTDRALTLGQLKKDALTVAANLRGLGLDPNLIHVLPSTPTCQRPEVAPVVVIQLPNCLAFAPVLHGVFASGLTASLVSPALTASELSWVLQNARPKVIVTAKACLGAMHEALKSQTDRAFFSSVPVFTVDVANDQYPAPSGLGAKPASATQEKDWSALLATPPAPVEPYHLDATSASNRTAVILWSSGTSGRSKGVLLSHNALVFATASVWHDGDYHKPGLQQRWLGYVPFYHVFGLCSLFLITPCIGATCYVMSAFNLDVMLSSTAKRKITYLHMAPPVAVMLAKSAAVEPYIKNGGLKSIVAGLTGGAPLGHEVVVEVYKRLGFRVRMGYGLSETCSVATQKGLTEADMHAGGGNSGKAHWGVELMIAADGQDFRAGSTRPGRINEAGEILVRSPGVTSAYLPLGGLGGGGAPDMSITTEALTPDGWFRTGDVGHLDAEGQVHITDRLKELIKVRAYQVAPAELEAVLDSSDAVADAGVIGIHDSSEATEWPRAFVVPQNMDLIKNRDRKGLEKLAAELKELVEKRTARYKWIVGGFVFVDAIPKSPSGKILRRVMRDGGVKGGIEVSVYEKKKRDAKL